MRNITFLGASALILALGVVSASAEPFNPVTGYNDSSAISDHEYNGVVNERRAASEEGYNAQIQGSSNLQQFREGK